VALTATLYNFDIDLADNDRGVYETLALRVARHPSESEDYLLARVIAYALEYVEGIEFSAGGLSSPDDPALTVRDLTGTLRAWIEIGTPNADRLHRATKAADRVVVYVHRDPTQYIARLSSENIHRAQALELWAIDRPLVSALAERLDRRMSFSLAISERELFVSVGRETFTGRVTRLVLSG
jgi:uncharacterized protein YaeQ